MANPLFLFNDHLVSFSPIPTLKWYRIDPVSSAETEIKGSDDFKLLRHGQLLSIGNVGPEKAGKYKCVAKNSEGTAEISASVKVAGKFLREY